MRVADILLMVSMTLTMAVVKEQCSMKLVPLPESPGSMPNPEGVPGDRHHDYDTENRVKIGPDAAKLQPF
jgi:hypothetical protein